MLEKYVGISSAEAAPAAAMNVKPTETDEKTAPSEKGRLSAWVTSVANIYPVKNARVTVFTGSPDNMTVVDSCATDESGKTKEFFDRPEWKELSESCLGCGTCTFVCPTCQCYDIKDFNTGHGVKRFRCWDSCMYSEFTKMSAGQPRLTQLERFRQRFMHKLVYFPTNNDGMFSCVGCGRCLAKCPIQMNIVKVMKKLGGNTNG